MKSDLLPFELPFPLHTLVGLAVGPQMSATLQEHFLALAKDIEIKQRIVTECRFEVLVDMRMDSTPREIVAFDDRDDWDMRKREQRDWQNPDIRCYTHPDGTVIDKDKMAESLQPVLIHVPDTTFSASTR